jgi:hypothetical protein
MVAEYPQAHLSMEMLSGKKEMGVGTAVGEKQAS